MAFKVEVLAFGETVYASNACRFATAQEADAAGAELQSRWMGLKEYRVAECQDPVNYWFNADAGRPEPLPREDREIEFSTLLPDGTVTKPNT